MKLKSLSFESGRRDSNPRPSAWKANALSTELLPQFNLLIRQYANLLMNFIRFINIGTLAY
jgi:hypothetical protein